MDLCQLKNGSRPSHWSSSPVQTRLSCTIVHKEDYRKKNIVKRFFESSYRRLQKKTLLNVFLKVLNNQNKIMKITMTIDLSPALKASVQLYFVV